MDVLRSVWDQFFVPFWGLFALIALTAGTFVFVAAEFALTTVERSTVDAHVQQVGDRRSRQVEHARNTLSFQLSGAQVGITITTLLTGYVAQPAIIELVRPGVEALGLPQAPWARSRWESGWPWPPCCRWFSASWSRRTWPFPDR